MKNHDVLLSVATACVSGFAMGLVVCQPADASDAGHRQPIASDAPLPPTEGCNPYIVVHPPDMPPEAHVMNDVTIEFHFDSVCGNWRAPQPEVTPALPLKKA